MFFLSCFILRPLMASFPTHLGWSRGALGFVEKRPPASLLGNKRRVGFAWPRALQGGFCLRAGSSRRELGEDGAV